MRFQKKTVLLIGYLILVVGLISYLTFDVNRMWKKEATWNRGAVVDYGTDTKAVIVSKVTDTITDLTVPYCALYEVKQASGKIDWNCSFQPWYMTKLQGFNYEEVKLHSDLSLHLDFNVSPFPSSYLTYPKVDKNTFLTHGTLPIPVTVKLRVEAADPKLNPFTGLRHYIIGLSGEKEVVTQKLVSWEVSEISTDWSKMSNDELQSLITKLVKSVDAHLTIKSVLEDEDTAFLDSTAMMFMEQTYLCRTNSAYCDYDVQGNAGPVIINYMYMQNRLGNTKFNDKFLKIAREKVSPFAEQYNKDFKIQYPSNCKTGDTSEECQGHYQDLQIYEFPICPVREIAEGNLQHDNVKLFTEVLKLYATKDGVPLISKNEISSKLTEISSAPKEKLAAVLNNNNVITLNQTCYSIVANGMKDSVTVELLKRAYVHLLGTTFGNVTNKSQETSAPTTMNELKRYIYDTKLQATQFPLVAHELYHQEKLIEGFSDRTGMSSDNVTVTSMPLTISLIYLFTK